MDPSSYEHRGWLGLGALEHILSILHLDVRWTSCTLDGTSITAVEALEITATIKIRPRYLSRISPSFERIKVLFPRVTCQHPIAAIEHVIEVHLFRHMLLEESDDFVRIVYVMDVDVLPP